MIINKTLSLPIFEQNKFSIGIEYEFYSSQEINPNDIIFDSDIKIIKESGHNQIEAIFPPYNNIVNLINDYNNFQASLKKFGQENGLEFYCNAKPFLDQPGNGIHINFSFDDSEFFSNNLNYIIGGLIDNALSSLIYYAPNEEDYHRYGKDNDIHSPACISWGYNNRSTAFRIIKGKRIENRLPSAKVNLETAIIATLFGVYDGIKNKIIPPEPIYGVARDLQYNQLMLPSSFNQALISNQNSKIANFFNNTIAYM